MAQTRLYIFYGIFVVLILVYLLFYGAYVTKNTEFAVSFLSILSNSTPTILGDLALFGAYTPPSLAIILAATAPPKTKPVQFGIALFMAAISYLLYVHLTSFINSEAAEVIMELAEFANTEPIISLVEGVRTFCAVTAGALVGLRINQG